MPVTIGVGLEEDGTRGVLGSIGGDGEGFGEVREVKDRAREEELFEFVKGSLASGGPIPAIVFLSEVQEGAGDGGVIGDEPTVEVSKAKE